MPTEEFFERRSMPFGDVDPDAMRAVVESHEFQATQSGSFDFADLVGAAAEPADIANFTLPVDWHIVPIDVQAYVANDSSGDTHVPLPFLTGNPDEPQPLPFANDEVTLPAGVHLHWALPDALLTATMGETDDQASLDLLDLPDRWMVTRILIPRTGARAITTSWVIDAVAGTVTPGAAFDPDDSSAARQVGVPLDRGELNAVVGGSLGWTANYESSAGRFAFHDPLDLTSASPTGLYYDYASYLVVGQWSNLADDVLRTAQSTNEVAQRIEDFGWRTTSLFTIQMLARERGDTALAAMIFDQMTSTPDEFEPGPVEPGPDDVEFGLMSPRPRTVLSGCVHAVSVDGSIASDARPNATDVSVALGTTPTTALAALLVDEDDDQRAEVERTLGAFTDGLMRSLSTPDGLVEIEQRSHRAGFASLPADDAVQDRYRVGGESGHLPAGRHARGRLAAGSLVASLDFEPASEFGRVVRSSTARLTGTSSSTAETAFDRFVLRDVAGTDLELISGAGPAGSVIGPLVDADATRGAELLTGRAFTAPADRTVDRPGPAFFLPLEPSLLIAGAGRSFRHGGDGAAADDGRLLVRRGVELQVEYDGLLHADDVLAFNRPSGIAGIADDLVRECLLMCPYFIEWLAIRSSGETPAPEVHNRLLAESLTRWGPDGRFTGSVSFGPFLSGGTAPQSSVHDLHELLLESSIVSGTEPDPVAVTSWGGQPWLPIWVDWQVDLDYDDRFAGWHLESVDNVAVEPERRRTRTIAGRSMLTSGSADGLSEAVRDWLAEEDLRDADGTGVASAADEARLADIADAASDRDLLSCLIDDFHEALLGLVSGDGESQLFGGELGVVPAPVSEPDLLMSGHLSLRRLRIVDTFGRVLDVDTDALVSAADMPHDGPVAALELAPRLLLPSRVNLALVDAGDRGPEPAPARIDQIDPEQQVSPVVGFLLPDHIDEALEFFDHQGAPIGQLGHDGLTGGVAWQVAPGRPVAVDAGPEVELAPHNRSLGDIANELLRTDVDQRGGGPRHEGESPLTALLRAIDTTLWTVDTYNAQGTEHIAGLVGRPIAVVSATLDLEVDDDLADLEMTDDEFEARAQRYDHLATQEFRVRLGELTRVDDGLLGFFVDHDYSRFHVVDRVVDAMAVDSRPHHGHLGPYGQTPIVPEILPLDNPYIHAEDELKLRYGQRRHLTLLMHPLSRVHVTSGIVPRTFMQLQRDWVAPGLSRLAPSVRVGPVLVDDNDVRLPLIATLGMSQLWTRRDSTTTWRDDPILAATQDALLPELPSQLQEGYIRINPDVPE